MEKYDFSGWATRNGLKCSDGRTIMRNAFIGNDGQKVPLVWNHQHNDPSNVLGHALLENRDQGVYAYCSFNDTESGAIAKTLVQHGDIVSLSIYANQLKQNGGNVMHGTIREVSLVHAGANPGAFIDSIISHGEDSEDEAIIYTGENISLYHSEEKSKNNEKENSNMANNSEEKTVGEIFDELTDEQKDVVYGLIGQAVEDAQNGDFDDDEDYDDEDYDDEDYDEEYDEDYDEGDEDMKHNVFDTDTREDDVLIHSALNDVLKDGRRLGSLKESYLQHAEEYGIENLDFIDSEDKNIYDRPPFINTQPTSWVSIVMNKIHTTPFANVKMVFADITEAEARAKGYIKGKYKKEEVFKLLKRSVGPCTIYKKQKFDRDDLIDADFDVIPWIKQEMNVKFDEEKARAYLFGDGRSVADEDKIKEDCIIPAVADEDLYTIKVEVTPQQGETLEHALITAAVLAQDDYQGSGNTTAFVEAKQVSKMLLMEDQFGHRLYKNMTELASAMGVGEVVKVPAGVVPTGFYALILDLSDYNVGMKNAGKTNFFDDFDINYNQQLYLMETRQSGALTRPYSAILLKAAN